MVNISFIVAANVGWSAVNYPDLDTRAVAVAVIIMFGSAGGVIASYLYPSDDKPYYSEYWHTLPKIMTHSCFRFWPFIQFRDCINGMCNVLIDQLSTLQEKS